MSARHQGRTQLCGDRAARTRLRDAEAQLAFAELASTDGTPEELKAATSCAVLAGIAAADAACCAALGQRSRAQDHHDAVSLLQTVPGGGSDAARQLGRLLGSKDDSQYSFQPISVPRHLATVRQARALVAFATRVVGP
jgi:hypothetical protein